jgi:hypothetical protein
MTTHKRIDGDYYITSINSTDNVIVTTQTLEVRGNLDVSGNLTYINVAELNIQDPFILLNSSNTSTYAANSGVLTHRTSTVYAGIRWSEVANSWQLSSSTSNSGTTGTWTNIATSATVTAAGANTQIQFNNDSAFGAAATFTFDSASNKFTLQGHQVLGNLGAVPASVANSAVMYHNTIGGGNTGVYVRTTQSTDELVAKRRAIAFGLIF